MIFNKSRADALMEKSELDALIATTHENVYYSSGFAGLGNQYLRAPAFVIIPREKNLEPTLICHLSEAQDVYGLGLCWVRDVRCYGKFPMTMPTDYGLHGWEKELSQQVRGDHPSDALDLLADVVREKGLQKASLGVDEGALTVFQHEHISEALSDAKLTPAYQILRQVRMVKTSEEIRTLREANRITEEGIRAVLEEARPGVNGNRLVQAFNRTVVEEGALPVGPSIALGPQSYLQQIEAASKRVLERGDLIRFDVQCIYKRYWTDIARNAVIGTPSEKQKRYYGAVLEGEQDALDAIRLGLPVSKLFEIAVDSVRRNGIPHYERHHVGHSIGLELYDPPSINPGDHTPIEENMILVVETPYYEMGLGGIQVEDTVLVTGKGYEFITKSSRELYQLA